MRSTRMTPTTDNTDRGSLSFLMDFEHVIQVHDDGTVSDDVNASVWAPPVYGEEIEDARWEFFTGGYSGQDRYSGPIMHASEFIGGGLARDILDTPGIYAAVVSECDHSDPDCCNLNDEGEPEGCEPDGWAIVRLRD